MATLVFYGFVQPVFLIFLLVYSILIWLLGKKVGLGRLWLTTGIVLNLLILTAFRYLIFILDNLTSMLKMLHISPDFPIPEWIAPLGISFITFRGLSLLIDIGRGNNSGQASALDTLQYLFFFPSVTAGPLQRPGDFLAQWRNLPDFSASRIANGLKLFVYGMFLKVVVADRLAILVNAVYGRCAESGGGELLWATLFYTLQIFADFQGYSVMAIGIGQVVGLRLPDNFNSPYLAKNIAEFWQRWHITLSQWIRDYLFLPLAFRMDRRWQKSRLTRQSLDILTYTLATLIAMTLCGLWHGPGWNFVLWGAGHGLLLALLFASRGIRRRFARRWLEWVPTRIRQILAIALTFIVVSALWIFFRSATLSDALIVFKRLVTSGSSALACLPVAIRCGRNTGETAIALIALLLWMILSRSRFWGKTQGWRSVFPGLPAVWQWPILIILILIIMNFGQADAIPFIYQQF